MFGRRSIHAKLDRLLEENAWVCREAKKMADAVADLNAKIDQVVAGLDTVKTDAAAVVAQIKAALPDSVSPGVEAAVGRLDAIVSDLATLHATMAPAPAA